MFTVIGDVHGWFGKYEKIVKEKEYTVQLGDFGFTKEWTQLAYSDIDPSKHFIIPGNHDCYDSCFNVPHCLGNFGSVKINHTSFFFIRGGYSIDGSIRRLERKSKGKTWWHQEQLTYDEMKTCEASYQEWKPDLVITHTPPHFIIKEIGSPRIMNAFGYDSDYMCNTSGFLDCLFKLHKPKTWIFAHMHQSYVEEIDGCLFIGLGELETYDIQPSRL
jgi:predicted phosphodiesterase